VEQIVIPKGQPVGLPRSAKVRKNATRAG